MKLEVSQKGSPGMIDDWDSDCLDWPFIHFKRDYDGLNSLNSSDIESRAT
jgi:hypothetical protein